MSEVYRSPELRRKTYLRLLNEADSISQIHSLDSGKNGIFQMHQEKHEAELKAQERNFFIKRLDFRRRVNARHKSSA